MSVWGSRSIYVSLRCARDDEYHHLRRVLNVITRASEEGKKFMRIIHVSLFGLPIG